MNPRLALIIGAFFIGTGIYFGVNGYALSAAVQIPCGIVIIINNII